MANVSRISDSTSDTGNDIAMPRWVKVFGTILIPGILLFVIMLFTRGPHGPGRHLRPGSSGGQTPSGERGTQQP